MYTLIVYADVFPTYTLNVYTDVNSTYTFNVPIGKAIGMRTEFSFSYLKLISQYMSQFHSTMITEEWYFEILVWYLREQMLKDFFSSIFA